MKEGKFVIQWHRWRKRGKKPVRPGITTSHYDLRIDTGEREIFHLVLEENPLRVRRVAGYYKPCRDKKSMTMGIDRTVYLKPSGKAKPGEKGWNPYNPTKDTDAWITALDWGKVTIIDEDIGYKKVEFQGKKIKGIWVLRAEDPNEPEGFWIVEYSKAPLEKLTQVKLRIAQITTRHLHLLKIKDVIQYDVKKPNDAQLLDDLRITCGWYATIKRGKAFKYTQEQVEDLNAKILKEIL